MKICFASSEAVPFAKTGGLADVAGGLTNALVQLGHDVTLILPKYEKVIQLDLEADYEVKQKVPFSIRMGERDVHGMFEILREKKTNRSVVLVEAPQYFDRTSLYGDNNEAYGDNSERFIFFSRAIVEFAAREAVPFDVMHANDWQTGLVPALINTKRTEFPNFEKTKTIFTIHNMNFQGAFWHWDMMQTGMDWKYFNWREMENYGQINLLKTGIVFADEITTVSPTYAEEIKTPAYGCGLENVLSFHSSKLSGILNGIDPTDWNPKTDKHLSAHYDVGDYPSGKMKNKEALQEKMGLQPDRNLPLVGMVSRMTNQKGFDLISACQHDLFSLPAQFVFLGSGDPHFEGELRHWINHYEGKVKGYVGYNEELAHLIEAGSDLFLMPSQFEPCGLNQLYSMAYGTLPVVHKVGGLADSVTGYQRDGSNESIATGFVFDDYTPGALYETVKEAIALYRDKAAFGTLIKNGMQKDWTWKQSAKQYLELYGEKASSATGVSSTTKFNKELV